MGKLILLFVILGVSLQYPTEIFADGVVCRADEEPLAEPRCVPTCLDPEVGSLCFRMEMYEESDCKCKEGYVRASYEDRSCVAVKDCPPQNSP